MQAMVFLNGGWMEHYEGLDNDTIHGGGSYVKENGMGWEIFNFKNSNGKVYGFVQSKGLNNLERISETADEDKVTDVLAVFTATHPEYGGTYVVGWYRHAIFYRDYQTERVNGRKYKGKCMEYNVEAQYKDTTLLSIDERLGFERLPTGKGGKARSNVWYADSDIGIEYKEKVLKFIDNYERKKKVIAEKRYTNRNRKQDVELKKKVEDIAIKFVMAHYENDNGYIVKSVENDKVGWDLEASKGKHLLRIEVKGLSRSEINVELTMKEYTKMNEYKKEGYRLAVVTNCLKEPDLFIFEYSNEKDCWIDRDKNILEIQELISARCSHKQD